MKTFALIACLLPGASWAQTAEAFMLGGLSRMGQAQLVSLETVGTEVRGNRVVDVKVTVGMEYKPFEETARIEVMTFEDGKLVTRQAGDGKMLWVFDVRSNTYSSTQYASFEGGFLKEWKERFFHTLKLRTVGPTAFTFRLVDDAFGTGVATGRWAPWMPMAKAELQDTTVVCEASNPFPNKTWYTLEGDDTQGYTLTGAVFELYDPKSDAVLKRWETTVTLGKLPDKTDFGFVPPRGARAVAIEQKSG